MKHLYPLELSISHDHVSATLKSSEVLDQSDSGVISELDFREPEDLAPASLNESEILLPSEDSGGTSLDKEPREAIVTADVNLPMVDVDQ